MSTHHNTHTRTTHNTLQNTHTTRCLLTPLHTHTSSHTPQKTTTNNHNKKGGENGFNQAIELSADMLSNVKFVQEKRLISKFFDEISQDTGKFCFTVKDTLTCLEMGAVETLIVWESLDCDRYELLNTATQKAEVKHLTAEQAKDSQHFKDKETGAELEVQEKLPLLEWLANNYKKFGCALEFVTNKSQEGSQFCRGFGGIGGILRYQVNMAEFEEPDSAGSAIWSDDDF